MKLPPLCCENLNQICIFWHRERIKLHYVPQVPPLLIFSKFNCVCYAAHSLTKLKHCFFQGVLCPQVRLDSTGLVFPSGLFMIPSTDHPKLITVTFLICFLITCFLMQRQGSNLSEDGSGDQSSQFAWGIGDYRTEFSVLKLERPWANQGKLVTQFSAHNRCLINVNWENGFNCLILLPGHRQYCLGKMVGGGVTQCALLSPRAWEEPCS